MQKIFLAAPVENCEDFLRSICPVPELAREEQFGCEDKQHADRGGGNQLDQEGEQGSEWKPFQEQHIAMMKKG